MTTQEIAIYQASQLDVDLIRRTIAPKLSVDEFDLFIARCKQTGLDPIARQIYALPLYDKGLNDGKGGYKMSIQTSIDGLRLLAERSGRYEGQIGPLWCDESGEWHDVWVHEGKPPVAAKVGVYKAGFREPLYAVAHYRDFVKKHSQSGKILGQWESMPAVMIAKVAESHALRRAFPQEMAGMYTREEMEQALPDDAIEGTVEAVVRPSTPKTVPVPENKKSAQPVVKVAEVPVEFNAQDALDKLYERAKELQVIEDLVGWQSLKCDVFGKMMPDESITEKAQCEQLRQEIVRRVKDNRAKKEVVAKEVVA